MIFKWPLVLRKTYDGLLSKFQELSTNYHMLWEDNNDAKELWKKYFEENKQLKKENKYLNKAVKCEKVPCVVNVNPFEFVISSSPFEKPLSGYISAPEFTHLERNKKKLDCHIVFFTPPHKDEIEFLAAKLAKECKKFLENYYDK